MTEELKKTGTTILGMVCKDGVVIATEHRATMGTLIAHKATKKLYQIMISEIYNLVLNQPILQYF